MPVAVAEQSIALRAEAEQVAALYNAQYTTGSPSALRDVDTVQLLLAYLSDGNYRETACRAVGISKQTLYNFIKRAEAGDVAASAFVDAMEKAEANAEAGIVQNVRNAAKSPQFWAAGMTLLQRRHPGKWDRNEDSNAPKVVVQIGAGSSDVTVNVIAGDAHRPDITEAHTSAIDVTPVDAVSKQEVSRLTEDALSDADTRRSRVDATRKAPGGTRRGNRAGTLPGDAGGYEAPRGVSSQRRSLGGRKKKASR